MRELVPKWKDLPYRPGRCLKGSLDLFSLESPQESPKASPKKSPKGMSLKAHPGASLPPGLQVRPFTVFKEKNRTWILHEPENPAKSI
jgi:hypothetical protein